MKSGTEMLRVGVERVNVDSRCQVELCQNNLSENVIHVNVKVLMEMQSLGTEF